MALYIDFDDLTPECTKRLLRECMCNDMVRQMPSGKRAEAKARMSKRPYTDDDEQAERDREELVDLRQDAIGPPAVQISQSDFHPSVLSNPMPALPAASKSKPNKKK